MVPETTGVYYSTMNHQALLDAAFKSNAWKQFKATKVSRNMRRAYRRGRNKGYEAYGEGNLFAAYLEYYGYIDHPMVQSVFQIVKPIFEEELFIYFDNDVAVPSERYFKLLKSIATKIPADQLQADDGLGNLDEEFAEILAEEIRDKFEDVECPFMMMGACLKEPEEFRGALRLMRSGVESLFDDPDMDWVADGWSVVDNENSYIMLVEVSLNDLPMDEIVDEIVDEFESEAMDEAIEDILKDKTATIGIGLKDNILFMGMAADKKKFLEFGSGPKMVDLPKLKPLKTAIENGLTITSVNYISERFAKSMPSFEDMTDIYQGAVQSFLKQDGKEIAPLDVQPLAEIWPAPQMQFHFSHIADDGIRIFNHLDVASEVPDTPRSLSGVQLAGENSLLLVGGDISRLKLTYEKVSQLMSKAMSSELVKAGIDRGLEELLNEKLKEEGLDGLGDEDRIEETRAKFTETLQGCTAEIKSFSADIDDTMRKSFFPSIENGEMTLLVDMIPCPDSGTEYHRDDFAGPYPIPAIAIKHSDKEKMVAAIEKVPARTKQFFLKMQEVSKPLQDADAEDIEELSDMLQQLEDQFVKAETDQGVIYSLSEVPEVDLSWFKPQFRVGDRRAVLSFKEGHDDSISSKRKGRLFGPAGEADSKAFFVMFYDNRVLFESIKTWFDGLEKEELPLEEINGEGEEGPELDTLTFSTEELFDHGEKLWQFLGCWHGFSSRSYVKDNVIISESLFRFVDVESP